MPGISTHFIPDLEEELEFRRQEKEQLLDQLALYDVRIDRYDAIIENMDRSILPLINEINVAISSVKSAYDARIAAGCKSDLVWTETARRSFRLPGYYGGGLGTSITQVTYTVTKNPAVRTDYGKWGAKYYRRPKNQDYGSNIVVEFFGSIGVGNTNLAIVNAGYASTSEINIGDTITDDIDLPTVFGVDDLPSVVSFGTSSLVIDSVEFGGTVTLGSTFVAHTGVGTTGNITVGNAIGYTGALTYGTTVVGFGTTTVTTGEIFDYVTGTFISTSVTANALIISSAALATTSVNFTVGITSSYPSLLLSTSADTAATNTNFTVIRTTQSTLDEFDYTNNPIDPVTIGIMNTSSAGYGHTLVRVNNGSPVGPFQWREVLGEYAPEPACGNSFDRYYYGNLQWPTRITYTYNTSGTIVSSSTTYASEGSSVIVSIGGTVPSLSGIGYTGTSSNNPTFSGCSALDTAITNAEASRDAIIARNQPIIDSTIAAASSLRILRDKLEGIAFTFLQGRAAADAEIVRLTNALNNLRSLDFTQYEPTNYRSANRFSSSTVGIATT